jgi:hypothetical protein
MFLARIWPKLSSFLLVMASGPLRFVGGKNLQILCGNILALANPTPL